MKGLTMASPQQASQAATPRIETIELKNYSLRERIGQTELATVYRAQHQTLDQIVHVHILRRSGWIAISRFQLAARLQARFTHPHIVPVIDAGHDEKNGYYLVTPAIESTPLQKIVDGGPIDAPSALRIFAQIGQALDYLHAQDVIHRDVQPQTILVSGEGKAFLTGFSLAWTGDGPDLSQLAEADYLTPYAAPEQTFEEAMPTPALDIYALGAVLFHMLTGEVPAASDVEQAAIAIREPEVAAADKVLRRMLAPQPQQRYPSVAQATAALRGVLRPALRESLAGTPLVEAQAETSWLENPLEIILGDRVNADFLQRSRERSAQLNGGEAIRRLLDSWSVGQPQRRRQFGQAIRVEQIVSYNLYFYDLKIVYETRSMPQTREHPYEGSIASKPQSIDRWDVDAPAAAERFADTPPTEIMLPHSDRTFACPRCEGERRTTCTRCAGRGTLEVKRTVKDPSGSHSELQVVDCAECGGAGLRTCERCDGLGSLLEQQVFNYSRRGRLWQNTDEVEGLPLRALQNRAEPVYQGQLDVHDPVWYAVQPLHDLLEEATRAEQDDTRIVLAELTIRGTPVTEVDYTFRDKPRTLAIIGFDQNVRGDISLLNTERLLVAALVAVIVVLLLVLLATRL